MVLTYRVGQPPPRNHGGRGPTVVYKRGEIRSWRNAGVKEAAETTARHARVAAKGSPILPATTGTGVASSCQAP